MNTKVTTEPSSLDTFKLVVAVAILGGVVVAYQYYADVPKLARVGGVIAGVLAAFLLALFTARGRQVAGFVHEAQLEARKVVWPTQAETRTTTLLVMAVVIVFAVLLWLLDLALGGLIQLVIGQGA